MAPLHCCGFRRNASPEFEPVRLVESSQGRGRFALSSHASSAEIADHYPLQEIFDSAAKDETGREIQTMSAQAASSQHDLDPWIHRKQSSRRLHGFASKIRKRMSLESNLSRRSSKPKLSDSRSTEDMERRSELKRALHRRVQDDLMEDPTASDNSYDEDAIPIKTPRPTWGRHEGSIHISPKHLSKALAKSGSHSSYTELSQRDTLQVYGRKNSAVALSRMLTQRASRVPGESEDQVADPASERLDKKKSIQKYVFEEESPAKASETRVPSPTITRATTVVRVTPSSKPLVSALTNPTFLDAVEGPESLGLLPTSIDKTPDSLAGRDWQKSFSERCEATFPGQLNDFHPTSGPGSKYPVIYDTKIRPASEQWLHGASGLLSPKYHSKQTANEQSHIENGDLHHCDPGNEEMDFGGIDGDDTSPPNSAYYNTRTRANSEGSASGHLYNIHVPKRLVSKSLLPSASQPSLQEPRRDRSYTSGDSSVLFSVMPRRQVSSEIIRSKIPLAWDNHRPRAASSVYSSQPESLLSSRRTSLLKVTSLSDRVQQCKDHQADEDIVSVPTTRLKPVNTNKFDRQTSDVSFHLSTESLTNRELAAAERRFPKIHRTNELPRDSRFKEDLDRISAELTLTNPPRRRLSNLDGPSDLRSPSITSPRSLSRLSVHGEASSVWEKAARDHVRLSISPSKSVDRLSVNEATSIWEKALREHAQEDAALKHTRIGSYSPDLLGPSDIGPMGETLSRTSSGPPSVYRHQAHLSVEADQGPHLQARLAAYKLPSYRLPPKKRPSIDKANRSSSPYPRGSWTRYPSHTLSERSSSPAGIEDQVFARDFADMSCNPTPSSSPKRLGSKLDSSQRKKSTNFGKTVLSHLGRVYKTQSQGLHRKIADEARGHRSSVTEEGKLEYPELELLGRVSSSVPSSDISIGLVAEERLKRISEHEQVLQAGQDSKKWSNLYEECVVPPPPSEMSTSPVGSPVRSFVASAIGSPNRLSEDLGPKEVCGRDSGIEGEGKKEGGSRDGRPGSLSSELRASTLDFKKSLELNEGLARERMLGVMERVSA